MYEWLQQLSFGPELICLTGGVLAAFVMALLRSFSLNRKAACMMVADSLMLSMFMLSLLIILGRGFNFWDIWWYVVLGTVMGYFGLAGIHQVIAVVLGIAVSTQLTPAAARKYGPIVDAVIKLLRHDGTNPPAKDKDHEPRH